MSADQAALLLTIAAAPPVTLFPVLYGFTLPWYASRIGRQLMISAIGLAGLVDISLAYRIFGADYQARDFFRLSAFSLVVVGSWFQLVELLIERGRRHRRGR